MMNNRSHRGIGLAELLGALAIFGLVSALATLLIASFLRTSRRMLIDERAFSLGNSLVTQMENVMNQSSANAYGTCVGNVDCIILVNQFDYVVNLGEIELLVHAPQLETRLEILGNEILIGSIALSLGEFTLDSGSALETVEASGTVTLTWTLVLRSTDDRLFTFVASHQFTIEPIPAG